MNSLNGLTNSNCRAIYYPKKKKKNNKLNDVNVWNLNEIQTPTTIGRK